MAARQWGKPATAPVRGALRLRKRAKNTKYYLLVPFEPSDSLAGPFCPRSRRADDPKTHQILHFQTSPGHIPTQHPAPTPPRRLVAPQKTLSPPLVRGGPRDPPVFTPRPLCIPGLPARPVLLHLPRLVLRGSTGGAKPHPPPPKSPLRAMERTECLSPKQDPPVFPLYHLPRPPLLGPPPLTQVGLVFHAHQGRPCSCWDRQICAGRRGRGGAGLSPLFSSVSCPLPPLVGSAFSLSSSPKYLFTPP